MKPRDIFRIALAITLLATVLAEKGEDREGRVVATQKFQTILTTTTTTTTGFHLCGLVKDDACKRRRRRRASAGNALNTPVHGETDADAIDSSLIQSSALNQESTKGSSRNQRIAYTIWWSSTSTFTVTSTTTAATTITVSYLCSVAGVTFPAACP